MPFTNSFSHFFDHTSSLNRLGTSPSVLMYVIHFLTPFISMNPSNQSYPTITFFIHFKSNISKRQKLSQPITKYVKPNKTHNPIFSSQSKYLITKSMKSSNQNYLDRPTLETLVAINKKIPNQLPVERRYIHRRSCRMWRGRPTFKTQQIHLQRETREKEIQYDFDSQIHFKTQQSQIMCFLQNFQEKETGDPFGF